MRSSFVLLVALGTVFAFSTAWADDYNPPTWRGHDNTTYQHWLFGTSNNPTAPDYYTNEFGAPSLSIEGDWPQTDYLATHLGRNGVWRFEEYMLVTIDNYVNAKPVKEIWLQLTYTEDDAYITTNPAYASVELIDKSAADDYYWNATWKITLSPNPDSETIAIVPTPCTLYVDQLVIDTICTVPEPTTICLLSLGGLFLLRKRRG